MHYLMKYFVNVENIFCFEVEISQKFDCTYLTQAGIKQPALISIVNKHIIFNCDTYAYIITLTSRNNLNELIDTYISSCLFLQINRININMSKRYKLEIISKRHLHRCAIKNELKKIQNISITVIISIYNNQLDRIQCSTKNCIVWRRL